MSDTQYLIGSVSKSFLSAAVGILVDQGKLQWLDPIQKYIPEFDPIGDPNIGQKADLIDALRHSTGLGVPNLLCLGPRSTLLNDEKDYIKLLNSMPTANHEGHRFNSWWMYNNYAYSLIAKVVEVASGQKYADYVKEHILKPLQMHSTTMSRDDFKDNLAYPYVSPKAGEYVRLQPLPCEEHAPLLAGMGMRSSINDMLTWSKAVLSAERWEAGKGNGSALRENPLRQMEKIRQGYWTRPVEDDLQNETAYCMGWLRVEMPSSMLGYLSCNTETRDDSRMDHVHYILGTRSKHMLTIGHNGVMRGSTAAVYTFPDTQSAVVVMANGLQCGDASDYAAQIIIQALFNLQPPVDLLPLVRMEKELWREWYPTRLAGPWQANRNTTDKERNQQLYTGVYYGFNGAFSLSIVLNPDSRSSLAVIFNQHPASICNLQFYKKDTYSFFPSSYEDYMLIMFPLWSDYRVTLLEFYLDESESEVVSLRWLWNDDEEPAILLKDRSARLPN
ncbi:serine hydrolase domain-containing protein [Aspergillus tanneri]|uniref:Beta-lactamase-related domain-containing protein n=1 Tax=Aspergillus tanneri TaxID=1220188 RepID=A0A5M9MRT6_9EURO|nr:uncharacterized protein ATNIH1004_003977 [Aspergillus tanneri]KAA8648094.1 hypothetical protein ATNIH1004_003977 [Aspergillus tanneri]